MKKYCLFLALLAGAAQAASLCAPDETAYFSCAIAKPKDKILSICGPKKGAKETYVQYRFGKEGHVELEYPKERKGSEKKFTYSRYTRPLVTYLNLKFQSEKTEYTVDNSSSEEDGSKFDTAGVTVKPPGKKEINVPCSKVREGSLMTLEDLVPNGEPQ